ncbi:MAG: hypothetical protein IPJ30_12885 [Acidobacteria bacterium]|nr:hypothetical protein [Acidobacteriota bacterium]
MKISTILITIMLAHFVAPMLFAQSGKSRVNAGWDSYIAHIGAAAASLRLHETSDAKRWLNAAPLKYRGWEWGYLNVEADQSAATFAGNSAAVTAIAVSPDGKILATASTDKRSGCWIHQTVPSFSRSSTKN